MERIHRMPFGSEIEADGGVRFRLWAPDAESVELVLEPASRGQPTSGGQAASGGQPASGGQAARVPMQPAGHGWYSCAIPSAGAGTLYRFALAGGLAVPDPASRFQPEGVHGPSQVIDPAAFPWEDAGWRGRAWEASVIYELHVGAFTPEGTFRAAARKMAYLAELGVTAVELMPVAAFPGTRNWGYDGVQIFAPAAPYGSPDDLKALVQTIHAQGMMALLDVVYNHFGPEGNYLHCHAKPFFTSRRETPWGAAIDFDGPDSPTVRSFFIHNALYWLEEFHFDGLRLDAVHAIHDRSDPDILEELAERVAAGPGRERRIHLILENDANQARYLKRTSSGSPVLYSAQWNDDSHHAYHCLLTGETHGYYQDYAEDPGAHLGRCLTEGFAYQGEPSRHRRGQPRGEVSRHLPPPAFVSFLQNHDQIGNRALGERLISLSDRDALETAVLLLLLAPSPPLLFMGEEFGCRQPFPFFSDFGPDLAAGVTEGRRREFAAFPEFADPGAVERIPDPQAAGTFERAVLDWTQAETPAGVGWLDLYRTHLRIRAKEITPRLAAMPGGRARWRRWNERALGAEWVLGDDSRLSLLANLGGPAIRCPRPEGRLIAQHNMPAAESPGAVRLRQWSAAWYLCDRAS